MKLCLLILVTLANFKALAIITKDCPKVIEMEMHYFVIEEGLAENSEIKALEELFSSLYRMSIKYNIKFAGGSKCYYEGRDGRGVFHNARLEGSTTENATKPAVFINKSKNMIAQVLIEDVSLSAITAKNDEVSIIHRGEVCLWGNCGPKDTLIAKGIVRFLK